MWKYFPRSCPTSFSQAATFKEKRLHSDQHGGISSQSSMIPPCTPCEQSGLAKHDLPHVWMKQACGRGKGRAMPIQAASVAEVLGALSPSRLQPGQESLKARRIGGMVGEVGACLVVLGLGGKREGG